MMLNIFRRSCSPVTASRPVRVGFATIAIAAVAAFSTPQAQAVQIDFVNLADHVLGEGAFYSYDFGAIRMHASASSTDSSVSPVAYLDRGNAGLGVCSYANAACAGNNEDNVNGSSPAGNHGTETLTLRFTDLLDVDIVVTLDPITFRDANHGTNVANVDFSIDAGAFSNTALASGVLNTPLTGTEFSFRAIQGNHFYISSVEAEISGGGTNVAEPATLGLLGLGLAGLGLAGRRRKTA
jgi:hypothetical protein